MAGRWGSFISGLESKLDTILADEDTSTKVKEDGFTSEQPERKTTLAVQAAPKGRIDGLTTYGICLLDIVADGT